MGKPIKKVILFMLIDWSEPKFVGLSWDNEFNQTITEFRRSKPPFMVQVLGTYDTLYAAQAEARVLIQRYHTQRFGWNRTDFGDLDNRPLVNKGGHKYNNGVPASAMPHRDEERARRSMKAKESAIRTNAGNRLPYLAGDTHPNKKDENRLKIKKAAEGRRRYYYDDGSWTWCYSKQHPLAYKNRDQGIPNLEDASPIRFKKPFVWTNPEE